MERDPATRGRLLLLACLVVLVFASGAGSLALARATGATPAWFPAAGVGVIAFLLAERRHRPALVAALAVAFALANAVMDRPPEVAVLLGLADVVETVMVGTLVERLVGARIRGAQDVWRLFGITTAGALLTGLLVALVYGLMLDVDLGEVFAVVAPSHGASVLLLAPVALVSYRPRRREPVHRVELLAQVLTLTTATLVTLSPGHQTMGLAPLPVLVWAAFRFPAWIVVLEQLAFAVAVSLLTQLGGGPFAALVNDPASSTRYAQLYLICVFLIGLPLAAAMQERERVMVRLSASERMFRRNFTASRIPIALLTCEQGEARFAEVNSATAELLGLRPADLVNQSVSAHLASPELFAAVEALEAGADGPDAGSGWSGAVGLVTRPRTRLEATLSLLEQEDEHASFSLHMVDVTEPQELQERLLAERDYTRSVIDTASSMIVVTDVEGTVLVANPATTTLTGFTEEELVGRPFWAHLISDAQRPRAQELLGDPGQLPLSGEAQLQTKDNGLRLVVFSAAVYQSSEGAPLTFVLSATDITEERESAGMVEHLLRSARTIAFVGTDLNGRISLFNTGAEHMLGISAEAATGRELVEFLAPEDLGRYSHEGGREAFDGIVEHAAGERAPETRDWTWLPAGRSPIKVSMTTNPVADGFGNVIGYLFVASDITDTRRSQQILVKALRREREVVARLKDLDRAKDEFVSTVSHELRTPMSSIIGSAEMLAEGMLGELLPEQARMVNVISRNGDRLLALADDLLVLATFDHDSLHDLDGHLDLRHVVNESAHSVAAMLASRRLDVTYTMPESPVTVNGDATHLERAVTNLLSNAVKFTPDGGSILVALMEDPERRTAALSVTDTGLGIPEADLEAVFGRFFRTALVQERAIQGSGLGLAIVKTIVESHEGRIDVRSAPGEGTTFTITLPLARSAVRRPEVQQVSPG